MIQNPELLAKNKEKVVIGFCFVFQIHIFAHNFFGEIQMAKTQSFADKAKGKKKVDHITVKFIKSVKTDKGSYKFSEKFVRLDDISKVTELK